MIYYMFFVRVSFKHKVRFHPGSTSKKSTNSNDIFQLSGKVVWLLSLVAIIATGSIFVHPVVEENHYKAGLCNITVIQSQLRYCTFDNGTRSYYYGMKLTGYYVNTGLNTTGNLVTEQDTWQAKSFKGIKANRSGFNSLNDYDYLSFGKSRNHPCSSSPHIQSILNTTLLRDFPDYNFTFSVNTTYPNQYYAYTGDPVIYQPCYYSAIQNTVILYKVAVTWHVVYFVISWCVFIASVLYLSRYGKGLAKGFCMWLVQSVGWILMIPFWILNSGIFLIIAVVGYVIFNYTMPMNMEAFCKAGGIFIPLIKCSTMLKERLRDRESGPTDDVTIATTQPRPVVITNTSRTSTATVAPTAVTIDEDAPGPILRLDPSAPANDPSPPVFNLSMPVYNVTAPRYDEEPPAFDSSEPPPPPSYDEVMRQ